MIVLVVRGSGVSSTRQPLAVCSSRRQLLPEIDRIAYGLEHYTIRATPNLTLYQEVILQLLKAARLLLLGRLLWPVPLLTYNRS